MISPKINHYLFSVSIIILISILFISAGDLAYGQTSRQILQSDHEKAAIDTQVKVSRSSDTMQHFSFPPVEIEAEYIFKKTKEEKKYHQLYEDIKRVYPLSYIVSSEIKMVNAGLDSIYKTKSQKKEYLKWYEKHTYNTYIDTLKALNTRQIKLFIKLIDRETGSTPFELIKKYRGGWDAFLWQLSANALMINLKNDYDPEEDEMIEDIIRKFY